MQFQLLITYHQTSQSYLISKSFTTIKQLKKYIIRKYPHGHFISPALYNTPNFFITITNTNHITITSNYHNQTI